jgi:hypothetical protein
MGHLREPAREWKPLLPLIDGRPDVISERALSPFLDGRPDVPLERRGSTTRKLASSSVLGYIALPEPSSHADLQTRAAPLNPERLPYFPFVSMPRCCKSRRAYL